ncbi:MAG TPA: hypothetical protein ENJ90_10175 [Devosia sp.]|nr:hypothetical protein [Devosia sp.]
MANYQELLSKAVGALPENNGAARREVYEKARKALVAQLRSITPSLPPREITQHRLELEDCIRQVEHEATEALLGGMKDLDEETIPFAEEEVPQAPAEAQSAEPTQSGPEPAKEVARAANGLDTETIAAGGDAALAEKPVVVEEPADGPGVEGRQPAAGEHAEPVPAVPRERPQAKALANAEPTSIDAIIARAEVAREKTAKEAAEQDAALAAKRRARDEKEAARLAAQAARDAEAGEPLRQSADIATKSEGAANASDAAVGAAMSRVREVEVEPPVLSAGAGAVSAPVSGQPAPGNDAVAEPSVAPEREPEEDEAQLAVDRAIQVLDREARGENASEDISLADALDANRPLTSGEERLVSDGEEERGGNALTIFLVLAIILLAGVGGGGYWAWREGYVDLDALFASEAPVSGDVRTLADATVPDGQADTPAVRNVTADATNPGPGNTTTDVEAGAPAAQIEAGPGGEKIDDRLGATTTEGDDTPLAQPLANNDKVEDRLSAEQTPEITVSGDGAETAVSSTGAQSLLLEASADGTTGAVPFSGTVEWSRGVDELGQPTLIGTAKIPARNLGVKLLIRRNADPSLPASHLMEIDFEVSETFSGGAVAGLPGILLKNEELVQGAALVGASARVVGNSFLFALSAAEQDVRNNISLLESNKWMDLALVYATGRRAIITLEKDAAAEAMFNEVLASWRAADTAASSG